MNKLTDTSLMPVGKHKGTPMIKVPDDYLRYLYNNEMCGGLVKAYIEENSDVLKIKIKTSKVK